MGSGEVFVVGRIIVVRVNLGVFFISIRIRVLVIVYCVLVF